VIDFADQNGPLHAPGIASIHGSPELDADAEKLIALGADPGITLQDLAPKILYTADSHFDHANIIRYCHRPFASVETMNDVMARNLSDADKTGALIVHCGDLGFDFAKFIRRNGPLWVGERHHIVVLGNHDDARGVKRQAYEHHFRLVIGDHKTWQTSYTLIEDVLDGQPVLVAVSHNPLSWDFLRERFDMGAFSDGRVVNVHGHIHNNALQNPDNKSSGWTLKSPIHFNAGVELHDYKPVTLQDLADAHRAGYPAWQGDPNAGAEFAVVE
jgi:calcineurin-like phosphoesterase family protein